MTKVVVGAQEHNTIGCLGGGNVDMNIRHGRLRPVGSTHVGNVCVVT